MGEAKRRKAKDPNYGKTPDLRNLFKGVYAGLMDCRQGRLNLTDKQKQILALDIAKSWGARTDALFVDLTESSGYKMYGVEANDVYSLPFAPGLFDIAMDLLKAGRKVIVFISIFQGAAQQRIISF